jgi:hypothetical protein
MDLRPNEQRDSSADLCASGRKYFDGIDLAVSPEVLFAEPPKSGNAGSLTRGRKKSHVCGMGAREFPLKGRS